MQQPKKKSDDRRILLSGVSVRALAESAVAAKHRVVTLDYFGDRDLRRTAQGLSLMRDFNRPFTADHLLAASRQVAYDALVYGANLENHPETVAALAQGRTLMGNSPQTLGRVRNWRILRQFCQQAAIGCPTTWLPGQEAAADPSVRWLLKPERGGGGHAIRSWNGGAIPCGYVLQAFVPGRPASVLFAADGHRCVLLGFTEQLIGESALGASAFRWCGNILLEPSCALSTILPQVETIVSDFTRHFALRGLNGIDLVVDSAPGGTDRIWFMEVNPRYTGAMELVEKAYGLNLFSIHLSALSGCLPRFSLSSQNTGATFGKAVVFATRPVTIGATDRWSGKHRSDIPFSGDRIEAGRPVCSVFARGSARQRCKRRLKDRAQALGREIESQTEEKTPWKHNLRLLPAAPEIRQPACTREKAATLTARPQCGRP